MRSTIISLLFGFGLAAATATAAPACQYHMTTASNDQATQTAQAQQPGQYDSY
jgi:hypothetical protein